MGGAGRLLAWSLVVAAASFASPFLVPEPAHLFSVCIVLAASWVILFAYAIVRCGKHGLWLLLGAPGALFWVGFLGFGWLSCLQHLQFCP